MVEIAVVVDVRQRAVGASVVVDAVEEHHHARRMRLIDQVAERVFVAEARFDRMEERRRVAPAASQHHRHQLERRAPQT